jgi:methylated-DNA-[protein]-cysteine S-methyltransferase
MTALEIVHLSSFDTAFGPMSLASTERGVVACSLPGERRDLRAARKEPVDQVRAWLDRHLPRAEIREGTGRNGPAIKAVRDYLAGRRRDLDLPLDLRGTEFQRKVWAALRRVPYGGTISYGELAARAGHPRASRACGSANGSNPVPLFIPCHRTIAAGGKLGGFGGALELKARLLELEQRGAAPGGLRKPARRTAHVAGTSGA